MKAYFGSRKIISINFFLNIHMENYSVLLISETRDFHRLKWEKAKKDG